MKLLYPFGSLALVDLAGAQSSEEEKHHCVVRLIYSLQPIGFCQDTQSLDAVDSDLFTASECDEKRQAIMDGMNGLYDKVPTGRKKYQPPFFELPEKRITNEKTLKNLKTRTATYNGETTWLSTVHAQMPAVRQLSIDEGIHEDCAKAGDGSKVDTCLLQYDACQFAWPEGDFHTNK